MALGVPILKHFRVRFTDDSQEVCCLGNCKKPISENESKDAFVVLNNIVLIFIFKVKNSYSYDFLFAFLDDVLLHLKERAANSYL